MRYLNQGESLLPWLLAHLDGAESIALSGTIAADGVQVVANELRGLASRGGRVTARGGAGIALLEQLQRAHPSAVRLSDASPKDGLRIALRANDGRVVAYVGGGSFTLAGMTGGATGIILDGRRDVLLAQQVFDDLIDSDTVVATPWVAMSDRISGVMDALEGRSALPPPEGVLTGHRDLDSLTGGGRPGQLWIVNGASGVGKTTFALGIARAAAIRAHMPTRWLSTTEDPDSLVEMVLSAEARVPLSHLRTGAMTDDDWARIARRMGEVADAPLSFGTENGVEVRAAVERLPPGQGGASVLVVDSVPDAADVDLFRVLHDFATATSTWVVAVADDCTGLHRKEAHRAQAQVADLLIGLKRADQHDPTSDRAGEADVRVSFSRLSPTATITLAFQGHYARFLDPLFA